MVVTPTACARKVNETHGMENKLKQVACSCIIPSAILIDFGF